MQIGKNKTIFPSDITMKLNEIHYKVEKKIQQGKPHTSNSESWRNHPIFQKDKDPPIIPKKVKHKHKPYTQHTQQVPQTKQNNLVEITTTERVATTNSQIVQSNHTQQNNDIKSFLDDIGMSKYYCSFQKQNINSNEEIYYLRDKDYENMGIPLGHKLRIMKYIQEYVHIERPVTTDDTVMTKQEEKELEQLPEPEPAHTDTATQGNEEIKEYKDINLYNIELPGNEDFQKARKEWLENRTQKEEIPHEPLPEEKVGCFNCYRLLPKSSSILEQEISQYFCSVDCRNKYVQQNKLTCSYVKCSNSLYKVNGVKNSDDWYCCQECCTKATFGLSQQREPLVVPDIITVPMQVFTDEEAKDIADALMQLD